MRDSNLSVAVSCLPDSNLLSTWTELGFDRWISVCGVGLEAISDEGEIPNLPGHVYKLADPFSSSAVWPGDEIPNKQLFLAGSTPALRNNLLRAVRQAAASLTRGEKLMVFCHLGRSRSPLVATAAMMLAFRLPVLEAWERISGEFEVAPLSELSLSALVWLESECKLNTGDSSELL